MRWDLEDPSGTGPWKGVLRNVENDVRESTFEHNIPNETRNEICARRSKPYG